jgi:outer membrane protein
MNNSFRKLLLVVAALGLAGTAFSAPAGTWGLRLRATYLDTANKSDAFSALDIDFAADAVSVQSKWIPEIDVSYWFTEKLALEIVLTVPQKHDVYLEGVGKLGDFSHLPPCFMGQYHFAPGKAFQPYVGLGLNLTLIMDNHLSVAGVPLTLENHSVGFAFQAGFDYEVSERVRLNFDVKKVTLSSDVFAGETRLTTADLNPWLISAGFAWRF